MKKATVLVLVFLLGTAVINAQGAERLAYPAYFQTIVDSFKKFTGFMATNHFGEADIEYIDAYANLLKFVDVRLTEVTTPVRIDVEFKWEAGKLTAKHSNVRLQTAGGTWIKTSDNIPGIMAWGQYNDLIKWMQERIAQVLASDDQYNTAKQALAKNLWFVQKMLLSMSSIALEDFLASEFAGTTSTFELEMIKADKNADAAYATFKYKARFKYTLPKQDWEATWSIPKSIYVTVYSNKAEIARATVGRKVQISGIIKGITGTTESDDIIMTD